MKSIPCQEQTKSAARDAGQKSELECRFRDLRTRRWKAWDKAYHALDCETIEYARKEVARVREMYSPDRDNCQYRFGATIL